MVLKIYIISDLEGISGIDRMEMIDRTGPEFKSAVERLMIDVNAAVDGAIKGGANYVKVLDGHGGGNNFDLSLLDVRAELDKRENGVTVLDETYDGIFAVGAHAMAGTINGFLDHTQNSRKWFNYWVNGRRTGELGQWGMWGAHYGVPIIMVSGDDAACTEARQFFGEIECASVKRGIGRNRAQLIDPDKAVDRIRNAAARAMELIGSAEPYTPILPAELKLELYRSDYCDEFATKPGVERLDARTVRKVIHSYLEWRF